MEALGRHLSYKAGFAYQDILGLLTRPIRIEASDLTRSECLSEGGVHILRIPSRLEGTAFEIAMVRELIHAHQREAYPSMRELELDIPDHVYPYMYQLEDIVLELDADFRIRQYGFTIPPRDRKYRALIGTLRRAGAVRLALKPDLMTQLALQIPYVDFIDLHEHYLEMLIQIQYCKHLYDSCILIHDEYITVARGFSNYRQADEYNRILRILASLQDRG